MSAEEFDRWVKDYGTGHIEHRYINGIAYLFVQMIDGWTAIFESCDGTLLPRIQAADVPHAESWCSMREALNVKVNII